MVELVEVWGVSEFFGGVEEEALLEEVEAEAEENVGDREFLEAGERSLPVRLLKNHRTAGSFSIKSPRRKVAESCCKEISRSPYKFFRASAISSVAPVK